MGREFGRPDLFVTFTCNPTWVDILNVLERQQCPEDRPDVVARVFKMKLTELLDVCECRATRSHCRSNTFSYINSPCMREGVCIKQYPKEFREKTEEDINGYPIYQRNCTESIRVGTHYLDNGWVVPYNPWLSKKFNAPINVKVCASIKCVKYLYKYVYKGHDAASRRFENDNTLDHDEILSLLDGRYVSAPEAMWRLNEFNISGKSHTVVLLVVHLPDQQATVYQDGLEEETVARAATRQTTLTAWFEPNKNDQDSHNYLYTDIPHYYIFNTSAMKWQKRQRGGEQVIGRMPVVSIQDSERHYLRLLFLRKLGAVSFDDLKTVDGIVCNTFQQACEMQGLLEGDQHWYEILNEAIQT
ncbi:hypothetical protein AVEN_214320-1 [Araneus ventricosus]|uniref:Helitron helicase-like domain-containing protein n=1 Tax=Araneus ventricosus TaxID=182803 RepID=A0A4Y2M6C7_ARAVE|nr:hypothetical protein AVEN_214320-1 [Araneus ventricosus]